MKKSTKKIALILSAFMMLQPVMFAKSSLASEITELELELAKINTKAGEYKDMSEKQLEAKKAKVKKELEKKKAKAKKEINNHSKDIKEDAKDIGNSFKEAGKDIGHTFRDIFSND